MVNLLLEPVRELSDKAELCLLQTAFQSRRCLLSKFREKVSTSAAVHCSHWCACLQQQQQQQQQREDRALSAEPERHLTHSFSTGPWRSHLWLWHAAHTGVLTLTVCASACRLAFCRRRSDLMNAVIKTEEGEKLSLWRFKLWWTFCLKLELDAVWCWQEKWQNVETVHSFCNRLKIKENRTSAVTW